MPSPGTPGVLRIGRRGGGRVGAAGGAGFDVYAACDTRRPRSGVRTGTTGQNPTFRRCIIPCPLFGVNLSSIGAPGGLELAGPGLAHWPAFAAATVAALPWPERRPAQSTSGPRSDEGSFRSRGRLKRGIPRKPAEYDVVSLRTVLRELDRVETLRGSGSPQLDLPPSHLKLTLGTLGLVFCHEA